MKTQEQGPQNSSSSPKKMIPPYMKAVSGSLGGIVEACCLQPIDVIKTRLQLDRTGTYRGIVHHHVQHRGLPGSLKSLTLFATHLTLTNMLECRVKFMESFSLSPLWCALVVKIRPQQQKGLSTELLKYKGPVHCARTIIREEGLRGLWAGAAPTVMLNGTNQAAMFTAKNSFDVFLWKKHEGDWENSPAMTVYDIRILCRNSSSILHWPL
ncbi:hypothetical protein Dsin_000149 [Dipteronia sinensis]|uniref:Uncharacterized protein n=1 Tax=Dipteronia sinensis TaxID=43782 RepID=A0AAE0DHJ1_9ROSI|nr:hypothetical protein Dsin_000149 [Dipteronia sinensis]